MIDLLLWELNWIDQNVDRYESFARAELVKRNITKRYLTKAIQRAITAAGAAGLMRNLNGMP